jgi:hypothetical protein
MIVTKYLQAFQVKYRIKMNGEDLYFKILQKSCFFRVYFFGRLYLKIMFIEGLQVVIFIWLTVFG